KISHPIWAAAVDAPTLAESASARDVAGAATGALFSHARAIATTPRSVASHLLHFICASLPTVSLRNACDRGLGGTAAHERDNGAPDRASGSDAPACTVESSSTAPQTRVGHQLRRPSQPLDVSNGRLAEKLPVFPGEVRRLLVTHPISGPRGVHVAGKEEPPGFLQPKLLLELQRAHRCDCLEVVVEARDAHPGLQGEYGGLDQDWSDHARVEYNADSQVGTVQRRFDDAAHQGKPSRDEQIVAVVVPVALLPEEHFLTALGDDAEGRIGDAVEGPGRRRKPVEEDSRSRFEAPVSGQLSSDPLGELVP